MVLSTSSESGEKGSSELEKAEAYIQSKRCSGSICHFDKQMRGKDQFMVKQRSSEIVRQ